MTTPDSSGIIRITAEDANSSHVDDLLKRQMSLRGEPGVTRDHGRKWYYQNWLILGLAGLLGALAAWAIIEPFFDDRLYIQGELTDVSTTEFLPARSKDGKDTLEFATLGRGSVVLNGQRIYLFTGTRELKPDGSRPHLDLGTLKAGETVGVYCEYHQGAERDVALGDFIVRSPPPQSAERAALTLEKLQGRSHTAALLLFPLVAGLIGLFIGAIDGLVCRLPGRALIGGAVGLLVGFVGGFLSSIIAHIAYAPLHKFAMAQWGDASESLNTFGFVVQMIGRALAWCLAGMAMGLGQGIALRSKRLLIYGFLGGVVGGVLGGLVFDPLDLILLGSDKPSAHWSRLAGLGIIGLCVGSMIGVVELLARDAWMRMTQGPLNGKEFLLFKDVMNIGSSPRSDIYLFNDPAVAENHAILRAVGDECEIEARQKTHSVQINNRSVARGRLRHGDSVTIGRTIFVFQRRKG